MTSTDTKTPIDADAKNVMRARLLGDLERSEELQDSTAEQIEHHKRRIAEERKLHAALDQDIQIYYRLLDALEDVK